MMKKVLAAVLMGTMVFSMAACGDNKEENKEETTQVSSEASAEESKESEGSSDITGDISVMSREEGSGTRSAFVELFGIEEKIDGEKVDMTTDYAQVTNSTAVMMTGVSKNPNAIGYISLGTLDESVKALKVDGAEANKENVKDGSYKIARPFNIATSSEVSEVAQDFIDYILSSEGQKIVEEGGYIAIADDAQAYAGTKPEGKVVVGGSSSVTPIMEKLKEGYEALNPGAKIEVQQSDSTTGMESAISGTYDIGMASRALKDTEKEKGLKDIQIALDGIAVIVNKENSFADITSDQVKGVYTGEITTWADLQ